LAILLGYLFPGPLGFIYNYSLLILGTIMVLSFLSLDLSLISDEIRNPVTLAIVLVVTKFAVPGLLYLLIFPFSPVLAVAVLLIGTTPAATVSPTLTRICGGNAEFALVILVLTALISPFSLPATIRLFTGIALEIDFLGMAKTLLQMIIIPFFISLGLRRLFPRGVEKSKFHFGPWSVLLVFILILGLMAHGAEDIRENLVLVPSYLAAALGLGILQGLTGAFLLFFLDRKRRISLAVGLIYINVGLSIVLAVKYFSTPVLVFALLYEVPANLLPGLVRFVPELGSSKTV
jgi:BASS family bile acid:Na+ symporter